MEKTVYIRMRNRILAKPEQELLISDTAQVIAPEEILDQIRNIVIHQVSDQDSNFIVVDAMRVVRMILERFPGTDIQAIGPSQALIEVVYKKKGLSLPLFILIWFLLFFGSAMTIMNFHDDVSMKSVQEKIYTVITGQKSIQPLLFQIPYSIGLGMGMILFFNHVFRKRINEEPSPLEVEMFNYQQDLDNYVMIHENKESIKRFNDN